MKLNPAMRAVPPFTGWESAHHTGGGAPAAATGHGLPFLLKVLSVRTALSIQVPSSCPLYMPPPLAPVFPPMPQPRLSPSVPLVVPDSPSCFRTAFGFPPP
eukprot:scaffold33513_cov140-Isochrysis_galbana.AAC.1